MGGGDNYNLLEEVSRKKKYIMLIVASSFLVLMAIVRLWIIDSNINYKNSDATWHTILTMKAYDETPISVHKFLPIVSLGEEDDKWINWGATIPDEFGNFYYTSFSATGYVLPYVFIKTFHLPFNESSLYLFNTILFLVSALLFAQLMYEIFKDSKYSWFIPYITVLGYMVSPEIIHNMGLVYWHQSIMQVTLLLQIYMYYKYLKTGNKHAFVAFLIMCLLNPYIEWTGYIANTGFAIVEIIRSWKNHKKTALRNTLFIGSATIMAFVLFSTHYLLVVDSSAFFSALKGRFFARNVTTSIPISKLFIGYIESFSTLFVLLIICFAMLTICYKGVAWTKQSVVIRNKYLTFVILFLVLENLVMKQHAIEYTFDRMKLVFILVFMFCDMSLLLIEKINRDSGIIIVSVGLFIVIGVADLSYTRNENYIWDATYRKENEMIADYISDNYSDNIIGTNTSVRGYLNCLFDKGIYECVNNMNDLKTIIAEKRSKYIILLKHKNVNAIDRWAMYSFSAEVYDRTTGFCQIINISDKNLQVSDWAIRATNFSDANWEQGIFRNTKRTILFDYNDMLLQELQSGRKQIVCQGEEYSIIDMDYDDLWIRVSVDKSADACGFPNTITFK